MSGTDPAMDKVNEVMSILTRQVQDGNAGKEVLLGLFEKLMKDFISKFEDDTTMTTDLNEVAKYTLMAGYKKRLRPLMVFYAGMCVYKDARVVFLTLPFALAVELVHTYSLIHDDLPCMDNATERRGQEASHIVHGEANALLAGNWLLAHAFRQSLVRMMTDEQFQNSSFDEYDLLDDDPHQDDGLIEVGDDDDDEDDDDDDDGNDMPDDEKEQLRESHAYMGEQLIAAQGFLVSAVHRMIDGQALDKQYTTQRPELTKDDILHLHMLKTSSLMQAATLGAAEIALAEDHQEEALRRLGKHFGLAFQIADDINDFDAKNPHPTNICTHIGIKEAMAEFKRQQDAARQSVKNEKSFRSLGTEKLYPLIDSIVPRPR